LLDTEEPSCHFNREHTRTTNGPLAANDAARHDCDVEHREGDGLTQKDPSHA